MTKVVIKVGTNSISKNGQIDYNAIHKVAISIKKLYANGKKPVLVSSGAVVAGMELLKIKDRPKDVKELQYLSAIGARGLWNYYAGIFEDNGMNAPYIPVIGHNFATQSERENIKSMIEMAWEKRDAVIFNTNDALTNEELVKVAGYPYGFYDNDPLAAEVAKCIKADYLVFITNQGSMGTGGGESKVKAIEEARKSKITVITGGISKLNDLETLLL